MAADIYTFVGPVIEDACKALNLTDQTTGEYVTTDPIVEMLAVVAYSQIETYVNRRLAVDTFNELYLEQDTRIKLRNTPVKSIVQIVEVDNWIMDKLTDTDESDPLVEDVDYRLAGNDLLILKESDTFLTGQLNEFLTGAVAKSPGIHMRVEYKGGYLESLDDPKVHSAILMQTVANYNRRSTLGTMSVRGPTGTGTVQISAIGGSPDAGDLLEAVKTILHPYVYYGNAVEV